MESGQVDVSAWPTECARPDFAAVDGTGLDGEPVHHEGDGLLAPLLSA